MKHARLSIVALVLLATACVSPESSGKSKGIVSKETAAEVTGPTAEQAAENRARPFVEGMAALERHRGTEGCGSPHAQEVLAKIAELEESFSLFHRVRSFPQYEREARDMHTNLSFAFADEALNRGCLDDADRVYRNLVAFYTGSVYAGIRIRAKLGIDDVRAARTAGQ